MRGATFFICPNNVIRTNFIKAKMYNSQDTSKCCIYRDMNEKVIQMIDESSKLVQKEQAPLSRKGYQLGIVQETEVQSYREIVDTQQEPVLENE